MARSRPAPALAEIQSTIPEMVRYLQDALGPRLTAVLIGVADTGILASWINGRTYPEPGAEQRVHDAFEITTLLMHVESPQAVRGWLLGMNPELDDRAPALALADDPERVTEAARIFIATG